MCSLEKRGRVYLLTLTGDGEHRLNPTLLSSYRSALAAAAAGGGAALVTAAEGKFFSNGFDQAWAKSAGPENQALMGAGLRAVVADLLSLPMPTIAAVTGHAAAAGCAIVLAHDYVVMRADRGFLYMSEVHAGLKIVDYFGELIRQKIPDATARKEFLLKGEKMTAREAVGRGIVDRAVEGGAVKTVAAAVAMAEELAARGWKGEVVAEIRKAAWPEVWQKVRQDGDEGEMAAAARPKL